MTSTTYGEKTTRTRSHTIADVAPKRWLRQMAADQVIVIIGRYPPLGATLPAWFEHKQLRAQVDPQVADAFDRYYGANDAKPKRRLRTRARNDEAGKVVTDSEAVA